MFKTYSHDISQIFSFPRSLIFSFIVNSATAGRDVIPFTHLQVVLWWSLPTGFGMIEKWDLSVSLRWFKGIYNGGPIGIKRILWLFYGIWWWFKASLMVYYDDNGYIKRL